MHRIKNIFKSRSLYLAIFVIFVYIFIALPVSNKLSADDISIIKGMSLDKECSELNTFSKELHCIKEAQIKALSIIPEKKLVYNNTCEKGLSAEPADFIKRRYGCCVHYSRLIEKTLNFYDLETRHIFMIKPYKGISLLNILPLRQQSHAATEVLTSLGWMGLDSLTPTILAKYDKNKINVYQYSDLIDNEKIRNKFIISEFYNHDLDIIYGLYSRHGFFYGYNLPGPEFNIKEVFYNL